MPVFAIYKRMADTCGNEDIEGPIRYVEGSIDDVMELFPKGFLVGFYVKEIEIETVNLIRIKQQCGE